MSHQCTGYTYSNIEILFQQRSVILKLAGKINFILGRTTIVIPLDRQSAVALLGPSLQGESPLPRSPELSLRSGYKEMDGISVLATDVELERHNPDTCKMKS